jgi:hypothetical protein
MSRRLITVLVVSIVAACQGATVVGNGDPSDFIDIPGLGATRVDVPRPTGAASAPCDDDPLPPGTDESTFQRVAALRAVGLFEDDTALTDAELAALVDERISQLWSEDLPIDDPVRDLLIAEQDTARAMWIDLEADVGEDNDVYVATIDRLAEISVGAFEPTGLTEAWASPSGPVRITFALGGSQQELQPAYFEDWIDPMIISDINEMISGGGRRFELYKAFDQTAFILALTESERRGLEARGWCFE